MKIFISFFWTVKTVLPLDGCLVRQLVKGLQHTLKIKTDLRIINTAFRVLIKEMFMNTESFYLHKL